MIDPETTVPTADAAVLLHVDPDVLKFLAGSAFAPVDDAFSARQLYGIGLLLELGMLPARDTVPTAISIASEADPHRNRLIAIAWPDRTPVASWLTNGIDPDRPPRRPVLVIPADAMFVEIINKVADYRARKARPN